MDKNTTNQNGTENLNSSSALNALPINILANLSHAELDDHVQNLKTQADNHWSIDPNISLDYAQQIIDIGYAVENTNYIALGLMAKGDALKNLGHIESAWNMLIEAGNLYQDIGDEIGWARTRIGLVFISIDMREVDTALEEANLARQIFINEDWLEKCAVLDMNVATVYHRMGNMTEALSNYENALNIVQSLGDSQSHLLWPIYYNLAVTYATVGRLQEAEQHYQYAIDFATEHQQTRNQVMSMTGLAELCQWQGKYRQALTLLHKASDLASDNLAWDSLAVQSTMAECYLPLNRFLEARQIMSTLLEKFQSQRLENNVTRLMVHLAMAEANLGNYQQALQILDEAETLPENHANSYWLSRQQFLRSEIAFKQGNHLEALKQAEKVVQHSLQDNLINANALLIQAQVHIANEQPVLAKEYTGKALTIARNNNFMTVRHDAYILLGKIAEANDSLLHAQHCYQAALAVLTRSQQNLTITLRPSFMNDKQTALHSLMRLYLHEAKIEDAFTTLERAKSQVLFNYLLNQESLHWGAEDYQTGQLRSELNKLRAEHQWYYNIAYGDVAESDKFAISPVEAIDQLKNYEQRIREITEQLYLLNEQVISPEIEAIPSIQDIQSHLATDDLLVAYYDDGTNFWAFAINQNNIQIHELTANSTEIMNLIQKLQANVDWALDADADENIMQRLVKSYQKIAQRLYEKLLHAPLSENNRNNRLIFVPYGALHYLPFNALFDGEKYLIENYEVLSLPSSGLLTRPAAFNQSQGARIIAHSHNNRLPFTHKEAQTVADVLNDSVESEIYLEIEAQKSLLALTPKQILHIAAHGEFRIDTPEFSYLLLGDGQIWLDDVLQYDLQYELVMLSGCETGRVQVLPGDELIGLGRSFLYAGASALIVSLWQVDDYITSKLTKYFYKFLTKGATKSAALCHAQQSMLGQYPNLHPTYWAALQLIGSPRQLSINTISIS